MKIGDIFSDGGFHYKVVGMHELGYPISKRIGPATKPVEVKADIEVEEIIKDEPKITKTAVNRMSTDGLTTLSKELGLDVSTGTEMKKAIIDKLGL